jgi:hypothetical protein
MSLKTAGDFLQQVSTDLFMIKEKLSDQEYKQILEHMMKLHESINRSNNTKRDLYVKLTDLRKKYIQLSVSFETLYRNIHEPDYIQDNENIMVID